MRLLRLDLERYGRFTDVSLDFPADAPLCMVLGRNEAGKSTSLAALLDFLFGFPARASYHFQHDPKSLRVGGLLALADGRTLHARRRRGNKNTLLGPDDGVLNEALIVPFHGGVDRDQFERLFGLDQERLREGGGAMLRSDGAVGALLVEAGEGLKGLVGLQRKLTQRLDELHRLKRNQSTETARLEVELKAARDRLRQCQLGADEWHDALASEQQAQELVQSLRAETLALRASSAQLAVLARVKPILGELGEIDNAIAALGPLPRLASTLEVDRTQLRTARDADFARREVAQGELAKVMEQSRALPEPDPILAFADTIAGFAEARGAVEKARRNSERRDVEIRDSRARLAQLARQLRLADAATLMAQIPDALLRADLQNFETVGTRLHATLDAAQASVQQVQAQMPATDAAADGAAAERLSALQAQHRRLESLRDLPRQMAELTVDEAAHARAMAELEQAAAALPGWSGSVTDLLRLPLPLRCVIEAAMAEDQQRQQNRGRLQEHLLTVRGEQEQWQHAVDELAGQGPVPTDDAVSAARQDRDQSWRKGWTGSTGSRNPPPASPGNGMRCACGRRPTPPLWASCSSSRSWLASSLMAKPR